MSAPQGSQGWWQERLGKVTSSGICAVLSRGKNGGIPVTRNAYMDDLIAERVGGVPIGSVFTSGPIEWGKDRESEARTLYTFTRDVDVEQVGFIDHPTIRMSGASLDGLVGEDGFVEIKAPNTDTHLETWRKNAIPNKYLHQIHWQAACRRERDWCDFISYDPRVADASKRLFVKRIRIDLDRIAKLEDEVRQFMIDMQPIEARVRAYVDRLNRRAAA